MPCLNTRKRLKLGSKLLLCAVGFYISPEIVVELLNFLNEGALSIHCVLLSLITPFDNSLVIEMEIYLLIFYVYISSIS